MVGGFESFGEYELHERVATGGMAEVFRATRRGAVGFEQELAIKRILPGLGDEEFTRMFIDEAKIAVRLSHPNVAQVFDLGRVDEQLYIALEYVHGRDLRRVADRLGELNGRAALPPAIAVHVAMRVARALHAAHTAESQGRPLGIIHRDVSPQNVLLSFEGQVKVIDFGLAKAAGRLTQTQAGVVKGKLAYLSSEQARGQIIDYRSDIFSLGTCLFEWLTGERLFLGKNDIETVTNVQKANVPSLRSIDRSLPLRLETIVMKALEPDPFMRFETAQAMAEALERLAYEEAMILTRGALARFMGNIFPDAERAIAPAAPQVSQAYELDDADLEPLIDFTNPTADPVEEITRERRVEPSPQALLPGVEEALYSAPPADFRPSALPAGFRPSALPGAAAPAPPSAPSEPEPMWQAPPAARWDPEPAAQRHDTMPAPPSGDFEAAPAPDPELDFDDDTSLSLDFDDGEGPTAQHHIDPEQVRAAFAVPEDEWDEEEATRQLDPGDF